MGEDEQSLHHILHKTGVILYYEHTSDMLIAAGGCITCSTKACLLLVLWLYPLCPSGWCFPGILPQASALTLQSSLKIKPRLGNFLGSPVVKTPCFQCRGRGFDPWVGNWNPLAGVQTLARPLLQLRIPPARDLTSQSIMPDPYCCDRQPLQCNQKEEKSEMGSSPSDPLRPFSRQPASPHSLLAILTSHLFFRCIKSFPIRGSKGLQFLLLQRGFIQFRRVVSLWFSFAFNTVSSQRTISVTMAKAIFAATHPPRDTLCVTLLEILHSPCHQYSKSFCEIFFTAY